MLEPRGMRYFEAEKNAEELRATKSPEQILIGVEWHGASLNGIVDKWADVIEMADRVEKSVVSELKGGNPRQQAMSYILKSLRERKHFPVNTPEAGAIFQSVVWLMVNDPRFQTMTPMAGAGLIPDEMRYVVTEISKTENNWRLQILFGDGKHKKQGA